MKLCVDVAKSLLHPMTITKSKVKKKHTISSNYGITRMFIEEHHFEFCEVVVAVMQGLCTYPLLCNQTTSAYYITVLFNL